MLKKLKNWYLLNKVKRHLKQCGLTDKQIERKIVIAQLRSHLKFFGCDTSDLTDEEIEQGVLEFSRGMSGFGVSVDEASEALALVNKM